MAVGRFQRTLSGSSSPGALYASGLVAANQTQRNPFTGQLLTNTGASQGSSTTSRAKGADPAIVASLSESLDIPKEYVNQILNPEYLSEANKYSAAGIRFEVPAGEDPKKYAQNPIMLRKAGDRLPSPFEIQFPWAYDASREPIIGDGGETLDPNDGDPAHWDKWLRAGYIPPEGTPAYKAFAEANASVGETLDQTIRRLGMTGTLGQKLEPYPTDLKPVTNREAIPNASSVAWRHPETTTVQNPDGTTKQVVTNPDQAGWYVDTTIATSPKNFPATGVKGALDNPNFKFTRNPEYWELPSGAKFKSIPGSSDRVGFNGETGETQPVVQNVTTTDTSARVLKDTTPPATPSPQKVSSAIALPRMTAL